MFQCLLMGSDPIVATQWIHSIKFYTFYWFAHIKCNFIVLSMLIFFFHHRNPRNQSCSLGSIFWCIACMYCIHTVCCLSAPIIGKSWVEKNNHLHLLSGLDLQICRTSALQLCFYYSNYESQVVKLIKWKRWFLHPWHFVCQKKRSCINFLLTSIAEVYLKRKYQIILKYHFVRQQVWQIKPIKACPNMDLVAENTD